MMPAGCDVRITFTLTRRSAPLKVYTDHSGYREVIAKNFVPVMQEAETERINSILSTIFCRVKNILTPSNNAPTDPVKLLKWLPRNVYQESC